MSSKDHATNTSTWVPICCETVMRHNVFQGDTAPVATLVCTACGKHITLQPHTTGSIDEYGEGAGVLQIVSVARPHRHGANAGEPASEDTM